MKIRGILMALAVCLSIQGSEAAVEKTNQGIIDLDLLYAVPPMKYVPALTDAVISTSNRLHKPSPAPRTVVQKTTLQTVAPLPQPRKIQTAGVAQLQSELLKSFSLMPSQIEFQDEIYIVPDHAWLTQNFIPNFLERFSPLQEGFHGEGLDCDNFAKFFQSSLMLSNAIGGRARNGDVPCSVMYVRQQKAFGDIPSTAGWHSAIIVRTNEGWHVVEPQTGAIAKLSEYPNLRQIETLRF